MTKKDENPILTLDELCETHSIECLRKKYEEKGFLFGFEQLLDIISYDYQCGFDLNFREKSNLMELPEEIPFRRVALGNNIYNIYGIFHGYIIDKEKRQKYKRLVIKTIDECLSNSRDLFIEQGLNQFLGDYRVIEFVDHILSDKKDDYNSLKDHFKAGFIIPFSLLVSPLYLVYKGYNLILGDKKDYLKKRIETLDQLHFCIHPFLDPFLFMPPAIELEMLEVEKLPRYTSCQKRSAYMSEFIRGYKRNEKVKNIFVGGHHVLEIEYFLRYGCKDSSIGELAQNHAKLLMRNKAEYDNLLKRQKNKELIWQIPPLLMGFGASSWIIYIIGKGLF